MKNGSFGMMSRKKVWPSFGDYTLAVMEEDTSCNDVKSAEAGRLPSFLSWCPGQHQGREPVLVYVSVS